MFRFLAIFIVCLLVLFTLDVLQPVNDLVIDPFNGVLAWISAHVIDLFGGDAISQGKALISPTTGMAVTIERVCNGIEAVIVLVSAMLAFPAPWKYKLLGVLAGTLAIQALNVVRIISLYYLHQWDRTAFDWFHEYIWQALIVLDALAAYLIWLRLLPRPVAPATDAADAPPQAQAPA
jgi:exosortase H (IPTLxxWG-CTERM-specific)